MAIYFIEKAKNLSILLVKKKPYWFLGHQRLVVLKPFMQTISNRSYLLFFYYQSFGSLLTIWLVWTSIFSGLPSQFYIFHKKFVYINNSKDTSNECVKLWLVHNKNSVSVRVMWQWCYSHHKLVD